MITGEHFRTARKLLGWSQMVFAISIGPITVFAPASSSGAPANTLRELSEALDRCLVIPNGVVGFEITIVFSLRRDGGLLGRPRISFSKLAGEVLEQRKFAKDIADAFDRCLPVSITDALGGAIAGRPMSIRFVVRPRETNT
jgi:hypothetical protein